MGGRQVGQSDRLLDRMPITARGDVADPLSAVQNRLVTLRISIRSIDDEAGEGTLAPALSLTEERFAAAEVALLKIDEAAHPGLEGGVVR